MQGEKGGDFSVVCPKNTTRTLRGEKPFRRYRREHRKNVDISMF
jgi:hypothetical protein